MPDTEVAIVGGGPIGLATAIFARRAGLTARVFEPRHPPIDKACGEGLMPDGVELLTALGWRPEPDECAPFTGIRYVDCELAAEARFPEGCGLGIRRPVLHAALARLAGEAGVELEWGTRVTGLGRGGVETSRGFAAARWVVGADGLKSRVRRWAGLEGRLGGHRRVGIRRHFAQPPWSDLVEVHWAEGCEAYVTPVLPRQVGVALLLSAEGRKSPGGFDDNIGRFPELQRRLGAARATSSDRGAGPLYHLSRAVCSERVALVGDAAGYLDAITGEGLSLGLQQARALVDALAAGDLGVYARANRKLVAWPFFLIRALLFAERRPWLRCRLVAALSRDPELFGRLLAIHARQMEPGQLGVSGAVRLLGGLAVSAR